MAHELEPQGHRPETPIPVASAHVPRPAPVTIEDRKSPFPTVLAILSVLMLILSCFAQGWKSEAAPAPAPAPAPEVAAPSDKPEAAPGTTMVAAPTGEAKDAKGEVAALSSRIDELQGKVDAAAKGAPAGDLDALKAKVAELAKVPDMVKPLPEKLDALDGRVGALAKDIDGLKAQLASTKKVDDPSPAPKVAEAEAKDADAPDPAMADAVALFKGRKYKEASAAFAKLALAKPNDARVLYFAALSSGFSTNNWAGDAATLAKKGVEREKAGTPEPAKIDESFADLTKATGKDWLDSFRKQAKP